MSTLADGYMQFEERGAMRSKVMLEKDGKWSVVRCKVRGSMLETGSRNFKYHSEGEALASISDEYMEMQNELMPMIFGDSYRRVFVHKNDFAAES